MSSQKTSNWRPKAIKKEDLLLDVVGDEVLLYNLEGRRVHCLNEPAFRIWKLCNGRRTVKEMATELETNLNPEARELVVRNVINEFSHLGLVEASSGLKTVISRRDMARRIGIGAVAAVALPLITSVVAPTPARAATCFGFNHACTTNSQCCSNNCGSSNKCK